MSKEKNRPTEQLGHAVQHHKAGDLAKAERIYQQILDADPNHCIALHLLGMVNFQVGKNEIAVDFISKSIAIKPDYAEAHNNLGHVFKALKRLDDAAASYQQTIAIKPDIIEAHNNLGNTLKDLGRLDEAVASYLNALTIKPDFPEAHNNLGNVLKDLGRWNEAAASYQQAISIKPNFAVAHSNLGNALKNLEQLDQAAASYQKAIAIKPDYALAHFNYGITLQRLGKLEEAVASYQKALGANPDYAEAHNNLGHALQDLAKLDEAITHYHKALAIKPNFYEADRNILFAMLYVPGLSTKELFAEHLRFAKTHTQGIPRSEHKFANDPDPDRRIRIGYISSDFRNHPVGKNVYPLLSSHDRAAFEVFCYGDVSRPDAMTDQFRSCVDHWRPIAKTSDTDVAEMVRADKIDVLVNLAGHFDKNRPLICAHRTAPVQVSFHDGATSGLAEMDYWLTDSFLHPPDTQEQFTEELYRLPVFYQYPLYEDAPPVETLPADKTGGITFGSFNNPAKVNEDVIRLWAKVLNSVAGSRLLLKYKNWYGQASLQDRMTEQFAAVGINRERIIFAASSDTFAKHLAHYGKIDIALDPFPFNGATTTFQALWMGVPVITLCGKTFISRAAGSLLQHVDLGDLAADTPEAYVRCAQNLAEDLDSLRTLRASLRGCMAASALCDAVAYTRNLEAAFRKIWQNWTTRPTVITIPAG